MEVLILNKNLETTSLVETFESLIWTDRYTEWGDFEIYTLVTNDLLYFLEADNYIWIKDSEHLMIIEDREIICDEEDGNSLIVIGRSLESLLERRIVWDQTTLTENFQLGIKKLLDESIISPTIVERTISNFVFVPSVDPIITALTIDTQIPRGENLYEAIRILCSERKIGFKITLSDENEFEFRLYAGVDRTYDQLDVPYVVFSPKFENLINSNYKETRSNLRNVVLVDGEGEGESLKTVVVGTETSVLRREIYLDASDIPQTTETEYLAQLNQKGSEVLTEYKDKKAFDGQIDWLTMYKLGTDFFIGDIVQLANEYGIEGKARVTEVIISQDSQGTTLIPNFEAIEGG